MLAQALPAMWIWAATLDLKARVLRGMEFDIIRGPVVLVLSAAAVLAPRRGLGWFALLLGIVPAVLMVCCGVVTGLFGAIVCTPPVRHRQGGMALLSSALFPLGWPCSSSA